ncbi:peptide-methionine (R)-S-oxide reductase MsrB [Sphingobium boeckii]|uniref:peptide-methionine (R)-S-oxide reductase n=1 Tax=Sphingobium boeckii TaxID=1082345 RepID=A0A7W9AES9_9SPHN|nr:peptide-methionine (R)-S-oxide reductase MsrB [Sphingobium boeckii]MBB5684176.1 peptide-methionine (R)-S-oxide reductase [Sphingobium boeckii]
MSVNRRTLITTAALGTGVAGFLGLRLLTASEPAAAKNFEINYSDAEWQKRLSPAQYKVLRKAETEYPGTSPLNKEKRKGIFACAGCALPLFSSTTKFESGTGWPSFFRPLNNAVATSMDRSMMSVRTEVHCRRCGGHLGHVFDDGPKPTGKRYCMNGVAMTFVPGQA